MAYSIGEASIVFDVIENMDKLLQTVGWSVVAQDKVLYDGSSRTSHCIWEGTGDGTDKIYIQARVPDSNITDLHLDAMAGYDSHLYYYEQPGSIQQWLYSEGKATVSQPMFTVTGNEKFYYWMFADTYRIIVVCRMSIVYESMYLGFINPIASERQYPYPMYVCGNGVATGNKWPNNVSGSFVFPMNNSGYLRRADGTWRSFQADKPNPSYTSQGTVFPYNAHNKLLVPNYKAHDAVEQDNFLLIPVMLQTNDPVDINGLLRDVYWISGTRDVASEQIVTYQSSQYIIFDTKMDRGENTYFAIKMF